MSPLRRQIATLLRKGMSDRGIAHQLGCDAKTVAATRAALRLPALPPGNPPAASLEDAWRAHAQPVGEGHVRWTGHLAEGVTPKVCHLGRRYSARRVAFRMQYGREPAGLVLPTCDLPACVAPAHMGDRQTRERDRRLYAAIFGGAA